MNFFQFFWVIFALLDPDPLARLYLDPIRIRNNDYYSSGTIISGRRCVLSWVGRRAAPLPMSAGHRRGPWTWAGRPADQATTQGEQLSSVPQEYRY